MPAPHEAADARQLAGLRSTRASIAVNSALSLTQVVVGVLAHSQGLVADGVHSLSDLVADGVVLLASRYSHKAPDAEHPYGHQRFETAASLFLGALLLAVAAGMLGSAVGKLQTFDHVPTVHWPALWVAAVALVAKESLFRYMLGMAERAKSSLLVANAWHARSDAASSLVVGLGILGSLAGYPLLDPIAAAIVGFMIGRMGWQFAWNAMHDLLDRSADGQQLAEIEQALKATPGVQGVHDLRTRKMGDLIVADVHLEVDGALSVAQGHAIAEQARGRVLLSQPVLSLTVHIDPWRAGPSPGSGPALVRPGAPDESPLVGRR